jgi:hypothetical protein
MESSVCATRFLFNDTATDVAASRSEESFIRVRNPASNDRTPLGSVMHAITSPATMGFDSSPPCAPVAV